MTSERRAPAALYVLAVAGVLLAAACADFSRGPASPPVEADAAAGTGGNADGGTAADGAALSFATDVYPLLQPTCGRCHVPGQEAGDTTLLFTGNVATDYSVVLQFVDLSTPSSSRLLSKMSGSGHGGGTVYAVGSTQYETVLEWIQQGARP